MLDLAAVSTAFPELSQLGQLAPPSGQKEVLAAIHGDSPVVLKLIKKNAQELSRTVREIDAMSKLACAYVPKVIAHGQRVVGPEVRVFIIEQRIVGQTYRQLLQTAPIRPIGEVLLLVERLLLACKDFEVQKFVHRDIKPENLIVAKDGGLWVIDFGLVRLLDVESLTPTGNRFGVFTPGYGAPEQMRNIKPEINSRADLFSIGVVAYESLNGSNPFLEGKGDILQVIRHVLDQDLPRLSIPGDVDNSFSDFLATLTARFPSRRPQSAAEALRWLDEIKGKFPA